MTRFRTNIFKTRRGEAAAFRLIPERIKSIAQLGLPDEISTFTKKSKGFVLVTGPTGSGKTTTLASLIDIINRDRYEHIITIEDPIEFIHNHKNCVVRSRNSYRFFCLCFTKCFKRRSRCNISGRNERPGNYLYGGNCS